MSPQPIRARPACAFRRSVCSAGSSTRCSDGRTPPAPKPRTAASSTGIPASRHCASLDHGRFHSRRLVRPVNAAPRSFTCSSSEAEGAGRSPPPLRRPSPPPHAQRPGPLGVEMHNVSVSTLSADAGSPRAGRSCRRTMLRRSGPCRCRRRQAGRPRHRPDHSGRRAARRAYRRSNALHRGCRIELHYRPASPKLIAKIVFPPDHGRACPLNQEDRRVGRVTKRLSANRHSVRVYENLSGSSRHCLQPIPTAELHRCACGGSGCFAFLLLSDFGSTGSGASASEGDPDHIKQSFPRCAAPLTSAPEARPAQRKASFSHWPYSAISPILSAWPREDPAAANAPPRANSRSLL